MGVSLVGTVGMSEILGVAAKEVVTSEARRSLDMLLRFYELWLAERMPHADRGSVFWQGEKIEYDDLREGLDQKRKYFISPSPYPGLRSFTPHEGRVFFGRRSDVDEVRERLKAHRMVMVLGGSGSGKSSLIRAGLLPHLNGVGRIGGRGGTWYWCEFRPELAPLANLLTALARHAVAPLVEAIVKRSQDLQRRLDEEHDRAAEEGKDASDLALASARCAEERERMTSGLAGLGLEAGATEKDLQAWVSAPFEAAGEDADALFEALWNFVDERLARLDDLVTGGISAGKPNILILLDQFEEIFRDGAHEAQRQKLLALLGKMDARLREAPFSGGGLFMAITIRSEELHRCGEYEGLTDIVNRSIFLLELLDPANPVDCKVLHRAIVEPARRVFISYGLDYDRTQRDSPFAEGVPDWLIEGWSQQWNGLEHRPDQLPLLQHALRSMWHGAIGRWKAEAASEASVEAPLFLTKADLPGDDLDTEYPDLDLCLAYRADEAAAEARARFRDYMATTIPAAAEAEECPEGELALRAAFSALARQDDRGNRARRFATLDDMLPFLRNSDSVEDDNLKSRLESALSPLIFHGYLTGGNGRPYDISHEALIRNWGHCTRWLRQNEEVVRALRRFLDDIDPEQFEALAARNDQEKMAENIPGTFRAQIAQIGPNKPLPTEWARSQVDLLLRASPERRLTWLKSAELPTAAQATKVLERIQAIASQSREARLAIREKNARADERARQVPVLRKRAVAAFSFGGVALLLSLVSIILYRITMQANELANTGLAISEIGLSSSVDWPLSTKLGILELALPSSQILSSERRKLQAMTVGERWDSAARSLRGDNFWISRLQVQFKRANISCWNFRGSHGWSSDENSDKYGAQKSPVVNDNNGSLSIELSGVARKLYGLDSIVIGNGQLPPSIDGSQICVNEDVSILTLGLPNNSLPSIFSLDVLSCAAECQVALRPVRASVGLPVAVARNYRPEKDSISAQSPPVSGSARVINIARSPTDDAAIVVFRSGDGQHQAKFDPSMSAARRVMLPKAIDTSACKREGGGIGEPRWVCDSDVDYKIIKSITIRGGGINVFSNKNGPPNRIIQMVPMVVTVKKSLIKEGALRRITILVPPDIVRIMPIFKDNAIDGLLLEDSKGNMWSANTNERKLYDGIKRDGDKCYIPPSILALSPLMETDGGCSRI
jgi:energy-coupling factor transporter ATP-binding protein EcfA2